MKKLVLLVALCVLTFAVILVGISVFHWPVWLIALGMFWGPTIGLSAKRTLNERDTKK